MNKTWYKIYDVSVRALLSYAKPCSGGWYFFLDKAATERCLKLPVREQEENALFDQLMIMRGRPITSKERGFNGAYMKYERVERKQDIGVLGFDGEGLISPKLAKLICKQLGEDHTSFQIRLPYIKGMLHAVDFHDFFKSSDTDYLTDIFGVKHKVPEVGIILTRSMVKCLGWLKENSMSWEDYWKAFERYDHALYISGTIGNGSCGRTELNYQFLNTLSLTADEFRPRDLPLTFPADDEREWLTKATEQEYYQLCCDDSYRRDFFLSKRPEKNSWERYLQRLLKINPKLIAERYYTDMLKKKAEPPFYSRLQSYLTFHGARDMISTTREGTHPGINSEYYTRKGENDELRYEQDSYNVC